MSEALEQMLEEVNPDFSDNSHYSTLDNYAVSVPKDAMYGNIDSYLGGLIGFYSFDFDPDPFGPAGPLDFMDDPNEINPNLEGNVFLDLKKSTPNTYIMKQYTGDKGIDSSLGSLARYIHHDRGPGRED